MQLTFSDEEAKTLHSVLHDYLPQLRRELARTELASRELRHELERRVALCERLVSDIERSGSAVASKAS